MFFLSSPKSPGNQCPVYKKQKSSGMSLSNPEFCGFLLYFSKSKPSNNTSVGFSTLIWPITCCVLLSLFSKLVAKATFLE